MVIYTDGSSVDGNPGNASARIVVEGGPTVTNVLGFHSNNYAELYGILMACEYARDNYSKILPDEHIDIYSDSRVALGWTLNDPSEKVIERDKLIEMLRRIRTIRDSHKAIRLFQWLTKHRGECPADFGNKR